PGPWQAGRATGARRAGLLHEDLGGRLFLEGRAWWRRNHPGRRSDLLGEGRRDGPEEDGRTRQEHRLSDLLLRWAMGLLSIERQRPFADLSLPSRWQWRYQPYGRRPAGQEMEGCLWLLSLDRRNQNALHRPRRQRRPRCVSQRRRLGAAPHRS